MDTIRLPWSLQLTDGGAAFVTGRDGRVVGWIGRLDGRPLDGARLEAAQAAAAANLLAAADGLVSGALGLAWERPGTAPDVLAAVPAPFGSDGDDTYLEFWADRGRAPGLREADLSHKQSGHAARRGHVCQAHGGSCPLPAR